MRNPVLETNLGRLSRYGYHREPMPTAAPAVEWAMLKGDFAEAERPTVPDLDELPPDTQEAAAVYLRLKREADQLLRQCEAAHQAILDQGLAVDRVEGYAVIRDAYEDKVEEFGAARAALSELLARA